MFKQNILLSVIFAVSCLTLNAQTLLSGNIKDEDNNALIGATIVVEDTNLNALSDASGSFILEIPKNAKAENLLILYLGYKSISIPITSIESPLSITMEVEDHIVNEVVISGKSESATLKETAYKPEVLDIKKMTLKATPVVQMMEVVSGVKIRQNGGLGSDFTLMVNGVTGKGIPVFIDNIPIDVLGYGFQLQNISPDIIQHVEIYKGIVPVRFGADALGGLVAIKTKKKYTQSTEIAYSYGSWNTHNASIGTYFPLGKHQFVQLDANYQHSDNNYIMDDVDVVVDDLGNTEKSSVNRFHDDYDYLSGRFQYVVRELKWTDELRFIFSATRVDKELQHGITAERPWGDATYHTDAYNGVLSYNKKFLDNKLDFNTIVGYSHEYRTFIDTSSFNYRWDGSRQFKTGSRGESGFYTHGRLPRIYLDNTFSRISANYILNEHNQLNFTSFTSDKRLQGKDVASRAYFEGDLYSTPQHLFKNYAGISWQSKWIKEKITNILSAKHFLSSSNVAKIKTGDKLGGFVSKVEQSIGFSNAIKYKISRSWSTSASYERATRLPDADEIFGDGLLISPNGELIPEKSHNVNVGVAYKKNAEFNLSGFYRLVEDQIFLNTLTVNRTIYTNLRATKTIGFETSASLKPLRGWRIFCNATYLKTTLTQIDEYGKLKPRYIGSRIPNIPFLFGNVGTSYDLNNVFTANGKLNITLSNRYVHRYFLGWDSDGAADSKSNVPTQFVTDLGLVYSFPNERISLSLECRNLTNQKLFDNYKVQKPGISFYSKIRIKL